MVKQSREVWRRRWRLEVRLWPQIMGFEVMEKKGFGVAMLPRLGEMDKRMAMKGRA